MSRSGEKNNKSLKHFKNNKMIQVVTLEEVSSDNGNMGIAGLMNNRLKDLFDEARSVHLF